MLTTIPVTVSAQLKVDSDGNVQISNSIADENVKLGVGYEPGAVPYDYNQYEMGIHVHSQNSTANHYSVGIYSNARHDYNINERTAIGVWGEALTFGSQPSYGLLGICDGSNGAGVFGSSCGFPSAISGKYAGYFDGATYVDGTLTAQSVNTPSDMRLKENVTSLRDANSSEGSTLDNLLSLDIIKYDLKRPGRQVVLETKQEKSSKDQEADKYGTERKHYGVSAQELQTIYPDLVTEGQDGYLSVNYTELVPILIRSIQELKQELDEVRGAEAAPARSVAAAIRTATAANGNVLYQNTPNPFKEKTTIRFSLAPDAQNVSICIFDMTGKMLKRLPVSQGENSVSVNGYELGEGMFLYSLLVNGQEVDTKRMVITK